MKVTYYSQLPIRNSICIGKFVISSISASPYFASQACFVSLNQRLNAFNMHATAMLTWN